MLDETFVNQHILFDWLLGPKKYACLISGNQKIIDITLQKKKKIKMKSLFNFKFDQTISIN